MKGGLLFLFVSVSSARVARRRDRRRCSVWFGVWWDLSRVCVVSGLLCTEQAGERFGGGERSQAESGMTLAEVLGKCGWARNRNRKQARVFVCRRMTQHSAQVLPRHRDRSLVQCRRGQCHGEWRVWCMESVVAGVSYLCGQRSVSAFRAVAWQPRRYG